jgi:hypothetical protein
VRPSVVASLLALALGGSTGRALAADTPAPPPTEPEPRATLLWTVLQLVPSPEVLVWNGAARFAARWQITPLLWSYGINRKLSPWRSFVVEPIVRHAGSIEAYLSPEILAGSLAPGTERWLLRGGLRSYFPLLAKGDYLSGSVGGALLHAGDRNGPAFDAALHTLAGFFGLRAGYCPTPGLRVTTVALEIRIF